jgi:hypothetical protein
MSYLDRVRLHFSGQFQADPSTVNNDPTHYDNTTFLPEYQLPQTDSSANGWWNPSGSASWRLVDCRVTRVCYADGMSTNDVAADAVVGMRVSDANKRVAGKLVDLDPQQQMVSQIWGLLVRLTDSVNDAFSGTFERASFSDLWRRAAAGGGKMPVGAFYQSVLAPVLWGDERGSRFLRELAPRRRTTCCRSRSTSTATIATRPPPPSPSAASSARSVPRMTTSRASSSSAAISAAPRRR